MNKREVLEYENNRVDTREREEKENLAVLEAFKPVVASNLEYLKYSEAKGWFKMSDEEARETALHNALVHIAGRSIKWSIRQARKLAFEILEDVNDSDGAAKVAEVLGVNE